MKIITFILVTLLAATSALADLRSTEDQERTQYGERAVIHKSSIEKNVDVLSFEYPAGMLLVLMLDGKVAVESFNRDDGELPPRDFVESKMAKYGAKWSMTEPALPNTRTAISEDGETYALIGGFENLGYKNSFSLVTKAWIEHAMAAKKLKI